MKTNRMGPDLEMESKHPRQSRIAVIIPCYNEEITIGNVIQAFKEIVPEATIYVIDNNCTDNTAEIAREMGAIVLKEIRQGKGFAIANIVYQVTAEYYIIIDGDDTYPVDYALQMLSILKAGEADMVVGSRKVSYKQTAIRPFHNVGNQLVRFLIDKIFTTSLRDPLSGFRGLTRKAMLTLPFTVKGFDIETELTIQALYRHLVIKEIEVPYRDRPANSYSKLHTFKDGYRVLLRIIIMVLTYKPLTFLGSCGLAAGGAGLCTGCVAFVGYLNGGSVLMVPMTFLTILFIIGGFLSFVTGLTIYSINHRIYESQTLLLRNLLILSEKKHTDVKL